MKTREENERELLQDIFSPTGKCKCDCDTCPLRKHCEINNPEFDANYCKYN